MIKFIILTICFVVTIGQSICPMDTIKMYREFDHKFNHLQMDLRNQTSIGLIEYKKTFYIQMKDIYLSMRQYMDLTNEDQINLDSDWSYNCKQSFKLTKQLPTEQNVLVYSCQENNYLFYIFMMSNKMLELNQYEFEDLVKTHKSTLLLKFKQINNDCNYW